MFSFEALPRVSVIGACLIAGMLMISKVMGKRLVAKYRRWIWLILAIQLLLPFNFSLPKAPLQIQVPDLTAPIFNIILPQQPAPTPTTGVVAPVAANGISVLHLLFIVWLAGFVLAAVHEIAGYQYTRRKLLRWSRPADTDAQRALEEMCNKMGVKHVPLMRQSKEVGSPMIIGLIKPVLFLPSEKYADTDFNMILCHELMHHKHGDMWIKLAILAARKVHWFNPLVYLMVRRADIDIECACDDEVVRAIGTVKTRAYSETILSAASAQPRYATSLSTHFKSGKKNLAERIMNIMNVKKRRTGIFVVAAALVLVLTGGLLVGFTVHGQAFTDTLGDTGVASAPGDQNSPAAQTDYQLLLDTFKVDGYAEMSVNDYAAFVQQAFSGDTSPLHDAYEMVMGDFRRGDTPSTLNSEDAYFLSMTLVRTVEEFVARRQSNYLPIIQQFHFSEIFGQYNNEYEMLNVAYDVLDGDRLTVSQRDAKVTAVLQNLPNYVNDQNRLPESEAALKDEVKHICQQYSDDTIRFAGE